MDHEYHKKVTIDIKRFIKWAAKNTDEEIVKQVREAAGIISGQRLGEGSFYGLNTHSVNNFFFSQLIEEEKKELEENNDFTALSNFTNTIENYKD